MDIKWDQYFMTLAYLVSTISKDTRTHIGAVVVDSDNSIRSTGYNSFPRGINDNLPERQERPEKYNWFAHGERNAIYNAARAGIPLENCRVYTQAIPCSDCAIAIIQSGITEVITHAPWIHPEKWKQHADRSTQMFKEAGIKHREYEGSTLKIDGLNSGVRFDPSEL